MVSKKDILDCQDIVTETVFVKEWGGEVRIKTLTGTEKDAWESSLVDDKKRDTKSALANIRAKLCSYSLVDEAGNRMFGDTEVARLGEKSSKALDRIFDKARKLSGIGKDDVEELAKNSNGGQSENSTSL